MKKLLRVLNKSKGVSAYKINVKETESCELFYVGKKLETNRASNVIDYEVTIYVDKDEQRGNASFTYYPYMDEKEIKEKIADAIFSAGFTLNKFYELPSPTEVEIKEPETNLNKKSFNKLIKAVEKAVFKADKYHDGYLSATEIFLYKIKSRIVNSKGVDISYLTYQGNIETIPSWRRKGEEVEVYNMSKFSSFDPKEIAKEIKEVLLLAKDRSRAKKLNVKRLPENVKIIIQDEEVEQVFRDFAMDLNYSLIYQKMNLKNVGDNLQGEDVSGDKLNLKAVPNYPNAMNSCPVDDDGVVLKEVELVKDGVALNTFGPYRFGYYLGVEKPTGNLPVMVVKEGKKTLEEMERTPYIRCIRFSGMQLDHHSGFIGGEVRLGIYFDGKKTYPVTGFSIAGHFDKIKGKIVYSQETATRPGYHGPKYLELPDMAIV
ncbi:MAG: hypothetical protein K5694_01425 [Bacilli bacterium]|nr:hypothetical protein [Bacilli bacterium]